MNEKERQAVELFESGYNCAQAVFAAFYKEMEMDFETAIKISSTFGGGMGGLREVCGAVSAVFAIIGNIHGYTDPKADEEKASLYAEIQALAEKFKDEHESIICRELLSMAEIEAKSKPEKRTDEYYKARPCAKFVASGARLASEYLDKKSKFS